MSDGYYEMDDVTIQASESKEQLRDQNDKYSASEHSGVKVTRTTEVTVTEAQPGTGRNGVYPWFPADA